MIDLRRLIFAICLGAFPAAANPQSADAVDPCSAERPFCGRLFVTITGAGERGDHYHKDGSVDGDGEENDTFSDYMQMRSQADEGLLSQSVVISSDERLATRVRAASTLDAAAKRVALAKLDPVTRAKVKEKSKNNVLLGVSSASKDTFEEFLNDDLKLSYLSRAIKNFENDPGCKAMQKAYSAPSILPFIMVQVHIVTDNVVGAKKAGEASVPLWPKKGMVGSYDQWKGNADRQIFDKELAGRVLKKLQGSVKVVLVSACDAGDFGRWFLRDGDCGCYLGSTNNDQVDYAGSRVGTPWAYALPDTGAAIRTMREKSQGAPNVASMISSSFRKYANTSEKELLIIGAPKHRNPLNGFIYSSVDDRVDKILKDVPRSHQLYAKAQALSEASFSSELGDPSRQANKGDKNSSDDFMFVSAYPSSSDTTKTLSRRRDAYKAQFKDIVSEELGPPNLSEVSKKLNSFVTCIDRETPDSLTGCKFIRTEFVDPAAAGVRKDGFMASVGDHDLDAASSALAKATIVADANMSRYAGGQIEMSELFSSLRPLWEAFDTYRKVLIDTADRRYGKAIPSAFRAALDYMDVSLRTIYAELQKACFSYLRQEVIKTRLAKLDAAVRLLSASATSDWENDTRELNNELGCLINFPIGPAFDVKYGKRMSEFLKEPQNSITKSHEGDWPGALQSVGEAK